MLILAIALALLIGAPQIIAGIRYFPKSCRQSRSFEDKTAIGNMPFSHLASLVRGDRPGQIDGVFFTEMSIYVGIPCVILALFSPSWHQWMFLVAMIVMAMGHWEVFPVSLTFLFFRIAARFCYYISLGLVFMSAAALCRLTIPGPWMLALFLIQATDLCLRTSRLWPMSPFCERIDRPSRLYKSPLTEYLQIHAPGFRVSGLPYPNRTGQIQHIRTLGYTGGSALKSMHTFLEVGNPNGAATHDWFERLEDGEKLDRYGVKYAYTYRPLKGKWKETEIPHLWRSSNDIAAASSFEAVEQSCR